MLKFGETIISEVYFLFLEDLSLDPLSPKSNSAISYL